MSGPRSTYAGLRQGVHRHSHCTPQHIQRHAHGWTAPAPCTSHGMSDTLYAEFCVRQDLSCLPHTCSGPSAPKARGFCGRSLAAAAVDPWRASQDQHAQDRQLPGRADPRHTEWGSSTWARCTLMHPDPVPRASTVIFGPAAKLCHDIASCWLRRQLLPGGAQVVACQATQ